MRYTLRFLRQQPFVDAKLIKNKTMVLDNLATQGLTAINETFFTDELFSLDLATVSSSLIN